MKDSKVAIALVKEDGIDLDEAIDNLNNGMSAETFEMLTGKTPAQVKDEMRRRQLGLFDNLQVEAIVAKIPAFEIRMDPEKGIPRMGQTRFYMVAVTAGEVLHKPDKSGYLVRTTTMATDAVVEIDLGTFTDIVEARKASNSDR